MTYRQREAHQCIKRGIINTGASEAAFKSSLLIAPQLQRYEYKPPRTRDTSVPGILIKNYEPFNGEDDETFASVERATQFRSFFFLFLFSLSFFFFSRKSSPRVTPAIQFLHPGSTHTQDSKNSRISQFPRYPAILFIASDELGEYPPPLFWISSGNPHRGGWGETGCLPFGGGGSSILEASRSEEIYQGYIICERTKVDPNYP